MYANQNLKMPKESTAISGCGNEIFFNKNQ